MVRISFSPINELVVHEVIKVDIDDLLRERITPSGTMPVYWCDGFVFSFSSVPMNRRVLDDYLNGKIHWMEVHYADMKDYKEVLELNDEHYNGSMKVRVIDTSKSALHSDFAKWLKESIKVKGKK